LIWLQIDSTQAFTIFTAVLIVACPCALALSTPFTLGSVVNILAVNGFYLKNTSVVEELSKTNMVVFDKTGTITESQKQKTEFIGAPLNEQELQLLASTCRHSTHPLSKAIFTILNQKEILSPDLYQEIPGKGIHACVNEHTIYIGSLEFL